METDLYADADVDKYTAVSIGFHHLKVSCGHDHKDPYHCIAMFVILAHKSC
jgi:hypothetical protein